MINTLKILIYCFIMAIVYMPIVATFKLHSIQKFGSFSLYEYYFISWNKLWFFYLGTFIGGSLFSLLIVKIIDKCKLKI